MKTVFDAMESLGLPREIEFLKIPKIRSMVSTLCFDRAKQKGEILLLEMIENSITNTFEHNTNALDGSLKGLDRGSELVNLFFSTRPDIIPSSLDILHIGPRNICELLCTYSYGASFERVFGLDLISYFEPVQIGDMHATDFSDGSFDVIFLGWVLAYSKDPRSALRECLRILRPNGSLVIGWDATHIKYERDEGLLNDVSLPYIENTQTISSYLNSLHANFIVRFERNPRYPFDAYGRQCVGIFEFGNELDRQKFHLRALESRAISSLKLRLQNQDDVSISHRLESHINFTRNQSADESSYLQMRHHYVKYGRRLDTIISHSISGAFPEIVCLNNSTINLPSFFPFDIDLVKQTVEELRLEGIVLLPQLVPIEIVEQIRSKLKFCESKTSRADANENHLLQIEVLKALWIDRFFLNVAEAYLGTMPILDFVASFKTVPYVNADDQTLSNDAQLWHFDKDRISFVKVFIYLTDVNEESGPHEFLCRTHQRPPGRDGRFSDDDMANIYPLANKRRITGKAGTIFIADTHGLHRGTPVSEGSREVLQFEYCNSLFGQNYQPSSIDCFTPRYDSLIRDFPRLFSRFL